MIEDRNLFHHEPDKWTILILNIKFSHPHMLHHQRFQNTIVVFIVLSNLCNEG